MWSVCADVFSCYTPRVWPYYTENRLCTVSYSSKKRKKSNWICTCNFFSSSFVKKKIIFFSCKLICVNGNQASNKNERKRRLVNTILKNKNLISNFICVLSSILLSLISVQRSICLFIWWIFSWWVYVCVRAISESNKIVNFPKKILLLLLLLLLFLFLLLAHNFWLEQCKNPLWKLYRIKLQQHTAIQQQFEKKVEKKT